MIPCAFCRSCLREVTYLVCCLHCQPLCRTSVDPSFRTSCTESALWLGLSRDCACCWNDICMLTMQTAATLVAQAMHVRLLSLSEASFDMPELLPASTPLASCMAWLSRSLALSPSPMHLSGHIGCTKPGASAPVSEPSYCLLEEIGASGDAVPQWHMMTHQPACACEKWSSARSAACRPSTTI